MVGHVELVNGAGALGVHLGQAMVHCVKMLGKDERQGGCCEEPMKSPESWLPGI